MGQVDMAARKLFDPKHEQFAQLITQGFTPPDAAEKVGYARAYSAELMKRPAIKARIKQLMGRLAQRAEFSKAAILDRMLEDWEQCRQLGQMGPAATIAKLLGGELHHMFTERKEIGAPGDFDNKSEAELREYIANELAELGLSLSDLSAASGKTITLPAIEIKDSSATSPDPLGLPESESNNPPQP